MTREEWSFLEGSSKCGKRCLRKITSSRSQLPQFGQQVTPRAKCLDSPMTRSSISCFYAASLRQLRCNPSEVRWWKLLRRYLPIYCKHQRPPSADKPSHRETSPPWRLRRHDESGIQVRKGCLMPLIVVHEAVCTSRKAHPQARYPSSLLTGPQRQRWEAIWACRLAFYQQFEGPELAMRS